MQKKSRQDRSFRHESLQDKATIRDLLEAITDGVAKGKLTFSDGDEEILMEPKGLLRLKLTATQQEDLHRLKISIWWPG